MWILLYIYFYGKTSLEFYQFEIRSGFQEYSSHIKTGLPGTEHLQQALTCALGSREALTWRSSQPGARPFPTPHLVATFDLSQAGGGGR